MMQKLSRSKYFGTSNPNSVRKQWLLALIIISTLGFLRAAAEVPFHVRYISTYLGRMPELKYMLFSALGLLLYYWVSYHCAYKNQGTKWLLFLMIIYPLQPLISNFSVILMHDESVRLLSYAINLFTVYFWIACVRLYIVNKRSSRIV